MDWQRWHRDLERCGLCGYARDNVRHERDREHAPEGLAYYADVPFCPFQKTGHLVEGADRVSGYQAVDPRFW